MPFTLDGKCVFVYAPQAKDKFLFRKNLILAIFARLLCRNFLNGRNESAFENFGIIQEISCIWAFALSLLR